MREHDSWTAVAARTTRILMDRTTRIMSTVPESLGSCQASVSGAVHQALRGEAGFAPARRSEAPGILLQLRDRSGTSAIDLIHLGAVLPIGVTPVGDLYGSQQGSGEWLALYSTSDGDELSEVFFGQSGEVRLHPLAGGHLGGQFAFKARSGPVDASSMRVVTVAGYFCARQAVERLPLTAGRLTRGWDLSGLGLEEDELGLN